MHQPVTARAFRMILVDVPGHQSVTWLWQDPYQPYRFFPELDFYHWHAFDQDGNQIWAGTAPYMAAGFPDRSGRVLLEPTLMTDVIGTPVLREVYFHVDGYDGLTQPATVVATGWTDNGPPSLSLAEDAAGRSWVNFGDAWTLRSSVDGEDTWVRPLGETGLPTGEYVVTVESNDVTFPPFWLSVELGEEDTPPPDEPPVEQPTLVALPQLPVISGAPLSGQLGGRRAEFW